MKHKIYRIIIDLLFAIGLYMLPSGKLVDMMIINVFNYDNIFFIAIAKLEILLVLILISRILDNFNKYNIMNYILKNKLRIIAEIIGMFILTITIVLRTLDKREIINISGNSWLSFIGQVLSVYIAILGVLLTYNQFLNNQEDENKSVLKMKPIAWKQDDTKIVNYMGNRNSINDQSKREEELNEMGLYPIRVLVNLSIEGKNNIVYPKIKDDYNEKIIFKGYDADYIDELEKGTNQDILLEFWVLPGMNVNLYQEFSIIYKCKEIKYKNKVKIMLHKFDEKPTIIIGDTEKIYWEGNKEGNEEEYI